MKKVPKYILILIAIIVLLPVSTVIINTSINIYKNEQLKKKYCLVRVKQWDGFIDSDGMYYNPSLLDSNRNVQVGPKPSIVDYDTYMYLWNVYTNNSKPKFNDKNKDYIVMIRTIRDRAAYVEVNNIEEYNGRVRLDLEYKFNHSDNDALASDQFDEYIWILIIPVEKGTILDESDRIQE